MLELKALLLTQGMHGMVSQVEGLAKALGLSYKHQKIELKSFWNLIPPRISPISENLVKNKFVCDCKVIISCGRKSVIPSIALKKRLGNQIFNIHIQDPKVSFKHFDLIVSPKHDNLKGENGHHIAETIFKAFGRAFRYAKEVDFEKHGKKPPSTKGVL